jgi:hypothetical protein
MSGKQRVWFAVYPPAEERRVRAKQPQFEATTLEAQHGWLNVDLTDLLPQWIAAHEYREGIFSEPEQFSVSSELEDLAVERVRLACSSEDANTTCVVAVTGLATGNFTITAWHTPYGGATATWSHGLVVSELGSGWYRARLTLPSTAGQWLLNAALTANPIGIVVPCHRIIGRDGSLTGYAGGLDRKVKLPRAHGAAAALQQKIHRRRS